MKLIKDDITKASEQIGLTNSQAESLWQALQETQSNKTKFNLSTVLLYLGALVAFASMTWFYTSSLDSGKSLIISVVYALIFFGIGAYCWRQKNLKVPGGVLSSLGIVMVPLIVYSLQNLLNWWPTPSPNGYKSFYYLAHGEWLPMEICTLLAACLLLYFIRFHFITVLIYFVIWFMSMDAINSLVDAGTDPFPYFSIVSIIIGFFLNVLGFFLYRKNQRDFGFWSYLFGMFLCWSGLTIWEFQTEVGYFVYFLINLAFLFLSFFFHHKIFMFFGSLNAFDYLLQLQRHAAALKETPGAWMPWTFSIILLATYLLRSRKSSQSN